MLKLILEIDELDYDALAEQYLPALTEHMKRSDSPAAALFSGGVPVSMAKSLLRSMPQEKKDRLCAELINSNAAVLRRKAEEFAAKQGVRGRVTELKVEAK